MKKGWHDLIQRQMDGLLDDEDAVFLHTALKSDAELRKLYLQYTNMDVALEAHASANATVHQMLLASHHNKSLRWKERLPQSLVAAVAMVAMVAMVAVAGLFWVFQLHRTSADIALMVESQGARWAGCTLPTEPGSSLRRGSLRLTEGIARLRFSRGADVTLEGPAELELLDSQLCRLRYGSLVAHVPAPARGFSVLTPSATLVDHGTDFGLSTDSTGHANVQVMRGEVELRHSKGTQPLRLTTQEMAFITPEKLMPAVPLEAEPRRNEIARDDLPFTTEITTRSGLGAAAYVSEPRTEGNQSNTLLLLKHCAEEGYGRKVVLRFDLTTLQAPAAIRHAQISFAFAPSGYGYASHGDDARIAVYALTQEDADLWNASELRWENQPAFDASAGRVDEKQAVRIGEFIVPRGVQNGIFSVEGPQLLERLRSDGNRLLTLILVRENRIEQGGGIVLGIAGNNHPSLAPPTLRVR